MLLYHVTCKELSCFGNRNGYCTVLAEAFKDKACPFYKSRLRHQLELEALEEKDYIAYHKAQRIDNKRRDI